MGLVILLSLIIHTSFINEYKSDKFNFPPNSTVVLQIMNSD